LIGVDGAMTLIFCYMEKLKRCLAVSSERLNNIPWFVRQYYDVTALDSDLEGLLLYPTGMVMIAFVRFQLVSLCLLI
jgi:hypothetical protein